MLQIKTVQGMAGEDGKAWACNTYNLSCGFFLIREGRVAGGEVAGVAGDFLPEMLLS